MKLTEKTKTHLKYSTANQDVADEVISALEAASSIISVAADPLNPSDGDVWYNQTTGDIKFRQDGATVIERNIIGKKVLSTGTASYVPSLGTRFIDVVVIGAGGGGGGGINGGGPGLAAGGGGGGGAVIHAFIELDKSISYACSIGTGGTGGTGAANGTTGGATSLIIGSTTYSAAGGLGGDGLTGGITYTFSLGGNGGAVPSQGDIKVGGQAGHPAIRLDGAAGGIISGRGADSAFGAGGAAVATTNNGNAGTGFGSGGSGGCVLVSATRTGGNGANGAIIITEYA